MVFKLAEIRQNYSQKSLAPEDCLDDAIAQFETWLTDALTAQVNEPTAMHLATVDAQGRPSARIVLLKGLDQGQFHFYTHYLSPKGQHITANPYVALTFYWPELERQVRIEGQATPLLAEISDAYFASRPYASRLGAWASEQSTEIKSKSTLFKRAALFAVRYPFNVSRPPHWGGMGVKAERMEFWQGRPDRLHDRVLYLLQESGAWTKTRLSP